MKEVLVDYTTRALEWLESGIAFVAGEVPSFIEELIKWNIAENIIYMVLFLVLSSICGIAVNTCIKRIGKTDHQFFDDEILFESLVVIFGSIGATGFIFGGFFYRIPETVQLIMAPRIWLVTYLAELVK